MDHRLSEQTDLSALSARAADVARALVSLSDDIAVVIDADGVVTEVAQNPAAPIAPTAGQWVGRPWAESVTGETRRKIELLLTDIGTAGVARRREVNLCGPDGGTIPVAYTALRLGSHGPVLALGRDLRIIAAIQQRFVETQQETERGYWRARQAESRHQLLSEAASDAVPTVDGGTLRIIEANDAAAARMPAAGAPSVGGPAAAPELPPPGTAAELARAIESLLERVGNAPLRDLLQQAEALARDFMLRQVPS